MNRTTPSTLLRVLVLLVSASVGASGQVAGGAGWIWGHWADVERDMKDEVAWFLREFELPTVPAGAVAHVACDNRFEVAVNGRVMGRGSDWTAVQAIDVTAALRAGRNVVAIRGKNDSGPAALFAIVEIDLGDGQKLRLESDAQWMSSRVFASWPERPGEGPWQAARVLAGWETGTWRGVRWAEPREFRPAEGFAVEVVSEGLGSLIALERADDGRVFVSVESGGILVVEETEEGLVAASYCDEIENSQGMLFRNGALWVTGKGGAEHGLYRIDDRTRAVDLIAAVSGGGGEHGAHAVLDGPDGGIWVVLGNHVRLEAEIDARSPFRLIYEGHLLPRLLDPKGHAVKVEAPGGTIYRFDPEGDSWQLVAAGFRNVYDAAFHANGDLFAWDSDMEWDIGMPWYREVCVYHVVDGGDYGWRTGSTKWPRSAADTLPPAAEVGRGSPTGCVFYDGGLFPERFRGALLAACWSRGRIYAFHLEQKGATWRGKAEVVLEGRPLNVTDLVVDDDGSVLFTLGGRGTAGGLYRLTSTVANASGAGAVASPSVHVRVDAKTPLRELVPGLASSDRFVRYAAARELERRDVASWSGAVAEGPPLARAEAALALARLAAAGRPSTPLGARIDEALGLVLGDDDTDVRRTALRALELDLVSDTGLAAAADRKAGERLAALFPVRIEAVDRSLAMLIARCAPPGGLKRLAGALDDAISAEEEIHLAYCMRVIEAGWTPAIKRLVARKLVGLRLRPGGASFSGYVKELEDSFAARLDENERASLLPEVTGRDLPARRVLKERRRDFDRVLAYLSAGGGDEARSTLEGARVYERACAQCHLVDGRGAGIGPDLTDVASRFGRRDLLESIMRPSSTISDQYRSHNVFLRDGGIVSGMLVKDDPDRLVVLQSSGELAEIAPDAIGERRLSDVSVMPEGLLDDLTMTEIGDLFAFLTARPDDRRQDAPRDGNGRLVSPWRDAFAAVAPDDPSWTLDEGELVGRTDGPEVALESHMPPGDFILEAEILLEVGAAALGFRWTPTEAQGDATGFRFSAEPSSWSALLDHSGELISQVPDVDWRPALAAAGFNHVLITYAAGVLRFELNGVTTLIRRLDVPPTGNLALLLGGNHPASARFRHLRTRKR